MLEGFANEVSLKKEYNRLAIIFFSFGFSYGLKFFWDEFIDEMNTEKDLAFELYICHDMLEIIESSAVLALLVFHHKIFKQQTKSSSDLLKDESPLFASTVSVNNLDRNNLIEELEDVQVAVFGQGANAIGSPQSQGQSMQNCTYRTILQGQFTSSDTSVTKI